MSALYIYIYIYMDVYRSKSMCESCQKYRGNFLQQFLKNVPCSFGCLREVVVTAVILTPGACGREGLGRTSLRRSGGSAGSGGGSQTSVSFTRNATLAFGNTLGRVLGGINNPCGHGGTHSLGCPAGWDPFTYPSKSST